MSKILIDEAVVRDTLEVLEKYSGVDQRACDVEEAINQALANAALDKMAENAKELGLSYEQPAQQDLPDLIAGALGVSRGTAYDMMREALVEQSARPWVGLTDEEMRALKQKMVEASMLGIVTDFEYIRSIEAKLKEKNT